MEEEPGLGAGPGGPKGEELLQEEEVSKLTEPLFAVAEEEVQRVAFHNEMGVGPMLKKYRDDFMSGFAKSSMPDTREHGGGVHEELSWGARGEAIG